MQGKISGGILALIVILVVSMAMIGIFGMYMYLSAITVVEVDYDGEFDDGYGEWLKNTRPPAAKFSNESLVLL